MADYDFAWRRAVNVSGTDIRASKEQPVLVEGFQYTIVTGDTIEIWFFITNVMDFRALPGFDEGSDATDDAQAPYHEGGETDFKLDGRTCAEDEE